MGSDLKDLNNIIILGVFGHLSISPDGPITTKNITAYSRTEDAKNKLRIFYLCLYQLSEQKSTDF